MAKRRTIRKKKIEPTWEELGSSLGKKMETEMKKEKKSYCGPWMWKSENGGGLGRFLFIISVLWIMYGLGMLTGISIWPLILLVIGFSLMKF